MNEIWILGATGWTGRAVAAELAASHGSPVLVGRDAARLRQLATTIGGTSRTVVTGSVDAVVSQLAANRPAVVVNTIGPFTETAPLIARACPPGTHYVDVANELLAVTGLLGLHDEAASSDRCLVTGAGFGVLATESVVLKMCEERPVPTRVRVDALAMVEAKPGRLGSALAGSIVDALAVGGRRYEHGQLVRARLGGDFERFTLPDGSTAQTVGGPSGELEAARRASGAPFVVAASGAVPTGRAVRAVLPAAAALLSLPALGNAAKRRLARVRVEPREQSRQFSWARARVQGPDGSIREGWLRAGEGMAFTASVAAEVASRLARDEGRPGAYTPGALFGPELAKKAGGRFLLDEGAS
ncbi:saccharopine dehydrogenase NADP-binding domain-containing protein [Streptomyces sp. RPT161]|uniref:saccharopine dehydrogenase NADP-binding domain-containing protein n=1 Tax=Streptomyces sp. RPT161 TaxID=3015993 RepID=UPI0022B894E2|nr:saccharopine dehydrogenase NADP-binding domain-containing protein [Streptomyces sp. RPT161]